MAQSPQGLFNASRPPISTLPPPAVDVHKHTHTHLGGVLPRHTRSYHYTRTLQNYPPNPRAPSTREPRPTRVPPSAQRRSVCTAFAYARATRCTEEARIVLSPRVNSDDMSLELEEFDPGGSGGNPPRVVLTGDRRKRVLGRILIRSRYRVEIE